MATGGRMAKLENLTAKHATALQQLLPPGAALRFAHGSTGHRLLTALAKEHARIEQTAEQVAEHALVVHAPGLPLDYRLSTLQAWLDDNYPGVIASYGTMRPLRVGLRAGDRCHSPQAVFVVHLATPDKYLNAIHSTIDRETIHSLLMSHVDIIITD